MLITCVDRGRIIIHLLLSSSLLSIPHFRHCLLSFVLLLSDERPYVTASNELLLAIMGLRSQLFCYNFLQVNHSVFLAAEGAQGREVIGQPNLLWVGKVPVLWETGQEVREVNGPMSEELCEFTDLITFRPNKG